MRRAVGVALGTLLLAACEFGERPVAPGEERPVVHAVLNPLNVTQSVLVERTLTGRVTVFADSANDPSDPITTGGGVPIHDARVTVIGPNGETATAVEVRVQRGTASAPVGTGVYRFVNSTPGLGEPRPPGLGTANEIALRPGSRYRLRVELPDGGVATGETFLPGDGALPPDDFAAREYLRDRDTLRLRWPAVAGARSYAVRVSTPYGAFSMFTDSPSASLTGELRNLFADRLPRVFQAGFSQTVSVAAVDTNYFDYYRSSNNPFTGSGLINRLTGGVGFFGGYVPILSRVLFVRATDRDPIDGRYVSPTVAGPELLRLWVDTRGNGVAEVSAAYRLPGSDQFGTLGTVEGDRIRLRALESQDYRRVYRTIEGTIRGDTIFAVVRGLVSTNDPGTRVFVKQPPPPDTATTVP